MITNIKIEHLQGHPKNPRLNVGDVTELADSIKEQGILQNLTVVPSDDGKYTVIIGHRRLEACKVAGLTEVPCAIAEMDEMTQVSTMLVENMQRADLTPYEEAQGIQQCLDLGMTDTDIIKKTGFSKSTIRNRKQMLKLNTEKVQSAEALTIDDYINLERIDDIEKRNELLEYAGTNDFKIEVEQAYQKQERMKRYQIILERLNELGFYMIEERNWNKHSYEDGLNARDDETLAKTLEALSKLDESTEYVYTTSEHGPTLYSVNKTEAPSASQSEKEEAEREARRVARRTRKELKPIFASAYQLRYDFMKKLVKGKMTDGMVKYLTSFIAENMITSHRSFEPKTSAMNELLGYETTQTHKLNPWQQELNERGTREVSNVRKFNIIASAIYLSIDWEDLNCYGHQGEFDKYNVNSIINVYDFLKALGYKMSDTETKLIEGTHELYYVEPKKPVKSKKKTADVVEVVTTDEAV
ncbi:ParB/RepB/Spo0J family partition protein [Erysipelothrix sp. HDW6C]|uniref:ParB/RepB/Spo0J family partition protein n=1 Tax=Erysipelothrix sp. HDW6C TaxID=2714930 RepID=UPI001408DEC4|nr:ParB/RepB/Spo0J family partition protein [Erysipelothrix sp. HDW6C]QIK70697.1 ParB/RepB/Spo0J family partition protein [Erysipelothrix sp. HDW6C]